MKRILYAVVLVAASLAYPAQAQDRWWECSVDESLLREETTYSVWRRGSTSPLERVAVGIQVTRYSTHPGEVMLSLFDITRWEGINAYNGEWTGDLPIEVAAIKIDDGEIRRLEFLTPDETAAFSSFVHEDAEAFILELSKGGRIAWEAQPVDDSKGSLSGSESLIGFTAAARECDFIQ